MAIVFAVSDLADKEAGRPGLLPMGGVVLAALLWDRFWLRRRGWTPRLGETETGS